MTCKICGNTIPKGRLKNCSEACMMEAKRRLTQKMWREYRLPWYLADRIVDSRPFVENFAHVLKSRRKAQ